MNDVEFIETNAIFGKDSLLSFDCEPWVTRIRSISQVGSNFLRNHERSFEFCRKVDTLAIAEDVTEIQHSSRVSKVATKKQA
jgi:hypothetical protein